jgi:hypothetical protein
MLHLDVIKRTCVTFCPLSKQLTRGKYYQLQEVSRALGNTGVLKLQGKENRRLPNGSSREEKRKEKRGNATSISDHSHRVQTLKSPKYVARHLIIIGS